MRCRKCGEEVREHWKACPACRAPVGAAARDTLPDAVSVPATADLAACYEDSWAVVVGANAYRYEGVPPLEFAIADCEAVASALTDLGFPAGNVLTLLDEDATKQNIEDLLKVDMAAKTGPNDRLFVFFAVHGQDFKAPTGRMMGYIIPFDGDPKKLTSRCISMSDIETWSELIPAKHILYVMDCCYSGLAATRSSGLDPARSDYISRVMERPVRQIITAGRADERVLEEAGHGVFTKVMVAGIRGEADTAGRGFVTGFDLGHYVESRVYEESGRRQQPLFRYLRGDGEFLFLRCPLAIPAAQSEDGESIRLSSPSSGAAAAQLAEGSADRELIEEARFAAEQCEKLLKRGRNTVDYQSKASREQIDKWKRAAQAGIPEGQWLIGLCLEDGMGFKKTISEAAKWYRKAANQRYAAAQLMLGNCYYNGDGVTEDKGEAVRWYRKAAEQGYALAQRSLGVCYYDGEGVTQDKAEAVKWYRKAAEQGDADAQVGLGDAYYDGEGVAQDKAEAVKWYHKAAEQGYARAQNNLGNCYHSGKGVTENKAEAMKWYRKAADQGYARAQNNLGNCYYSGEGVAEDNAEAVRWYRKAADQGYARAQNNLGDCYFNGKGVTEDKVEAVRWYRKAAEQGNPSGQFSLGFCYFNGKGVAKDKAEAAKWYRKAAEQGNAVAQSWVGYCYQHGEGVAKDKVEAVKWYRKAAELGNEEAKKKLRNIGTFLGRLGLK